MSGPPVPTDRPPSHDNSQQFIGDLNHETHSLEDLARLRSRRRHWFRQSVRTRWCWWRRRWRWWWTSCRWWWWRWRTSCRWWWRWRTSCRWRRTSWWRWWWTCQWRWASVYGWWRRSARRRGSRSACTIGRWWRACVAERWSSGRHHSNSGIQSAQPWWTVSHGPSAASRDPSSRSPSGHGRTVGNGCDADSTGRCQSRSRSYGRRSPTRRRNHEPDWTIPADHRLGGQRQHRNRGTTRERAARGRRRSIARW